MGWYKKAKNSEEANKAFHEYVDKDIWIPVESSWLDAIAYFETARILEIKLKNGLKYPFFNVPKEVYVAFLESPSKGFFFNNVIKKKYSKL